MIELVSTPLGHKVRENLQYGVVSEYLTDVLVDSGIPHGLVTGDWVYIQSDVEAYNGYKRVFEDGIPTLFTFYPYQFGDLAQDFIKVTELYFQKVVFDHTVCAVHNPIVYELESTLFPFNAEEDAYTPTTVASSSNENGYTRILLSAALVDATALAWLQIGENIYQIISVTSSTNVVINLAYNASNLLSGPVVKYYNNYCINVEVWCGYQASHPYESYKPMELAAVLKFIPDENNRAKFSISEIVRSYITTRNNLALDTLPNNTDFSCEFYIGYYESYDISDGSEITTYNAPVDYYQPVEDYGLAINAMMPFKSIDAGYMSEYVGTGIYLAKWLTLQESITWIVGLFMDLSFINYGYIGANMQVLQNGELLDEFANPGNGVIRVPLTFALAGEYCIQVWSVGQPLIPASEEDLTSELTAAPTGFISTGSGDVAWVLDVQPNADMTTGSPFSPAETQYLAYDYPFISGQNYTLKVNLGVAFTGVNQNPRTLYLDILNSANSLQFRESTVSPAVSSNFQVEITFTATSACTRYGIKYRSGGGIRSLLFNDAELYLNVAEVPAITAAALTEAICITVVEECDSTIVPDDDIRLLEDGDFRILE